MYKEKLNNLFEKAAKTGQTEISNWIIDSLKALVRYQNHVIEGAILSQARQNGIDIPHAEIEKNNKERIKMHDEAIKGMLRVNKLASGVGAQRIFDITPTPMQNDNLYQYSPDDHMKAAYIVAEFVNEYYDLGLQFERYDRAIDETTYSKASVREQEWFRANEFDLPHREYSMARIDNIQSVTKEKVEKEEKNLENFHELLKSGKSVQVELQNGVKLDVKNNDGTYDVSVTAKRDFKNTYGILTPETNAGFEQSPDDPKTKVALDMFESQLRDIVKQNGGFSDKTIQDYNLDEER